MFLKAKKDSKRGQNTHHWDVSLKSIMGFYHIRQEFQPLVCNFSLSLCLCNCFSHVLFASHISFQFYLFMPTVPAWEEMNLRQPFTNRTMLKKVKLCPGRGNCHPVEQKARNVFSTSETPCPLRSSLAWGLHAKGHNTAITISPHYQLTKINTVLFFQWIICVTLNRYKHQSQIWHKDFRHEDEVTFQKYLIYKCTACLASNVLPQLDVGIFVTLKDHFIYIFAKSTI